MRARGFSLIEFMIAMTIGLFLIAGLVYLIAETSRSRAEIERSSRQIENGRYAIDRLSEDLRHAGFYSEYYELSDPVAADPCETDIANLPNGMPLGIQAYVGAGATPPLACIPAADYEPDTDVLVVRRASTLAIAKTALPAGADKQAYIQTTPKAFLLKLGITGNFNLMLPSVNTTAEVDAPVRRYIVRIYFVSKCNVPASGATCDAGADGGTPIPTLKMLELTDVTAAPNFQKLAIAEGIEQLRFDFGIDTTGDGVADGALSKCAGCTPLDWSNVVSVQINLIARNTERSPNYTDDKTYALGLSGNYTPPAAPAPGVRGYRRHAYNTFVRLNNIAMRREL